MTVGPTTQRLCLLAVDCAALGGVVAAQTLLFPQRKTCLYLVGKLSVWLTIAPETWFKDVFKGRG
ncbi:hypothetical protein BSL82_09640 [Tardibacter chloracetimidivorans]|uniref:Uncharacterized protein n=1 Tax=Tardibacter chloracetimidivorans TaxID=1921510 RepID=A0A1L3ZV90_9SPHN|nr:hypothetical protein BSL82_09640 [Tardibacter chloracetimidivorans]